MEEDELTSEELDSYVDNLNRAKQIAKALNCSVNEALLLMLYEDLDTIRFNVA